MKIILRVVLTIAIVTAVWVDGASAARMCYFDDNSTCGDGAGVVDNYCAPFQLEPGQTSYQCVDICDDGGAHFYFEHPCSITAL